MRLRFGLAVGFGVGYYFGARAGRERYEQLNERLRRLWESPAVGTVSGKAREAIETGIDKAREAVETRMGNGRHALDAPADSGTPYGL